VHCNTLQDAARRCDALQVVARWMSHAALRHVGVLYCALCAVEVGLVCVCVRESVSVCVFHCLSLSFIHSRNTLVCVFIVCFLCFYCVFIVCLLCVYCLFIVCVYCVCTVDTHLCVCLCVCLFACVCVCLYCFTVLSAYTPDTHTLTHAHAHIQTHTYARK